MFAVPRKLTSFLNSQQTDLPASNFQKWHQLTDVQLVLHLSDILMPNVTAAVPHLFIVRTKHTLSFAPGRFGIAIYRVPTGSPLERIMHNEPPTLAPRRLL